MIHYGNKVLEKHVKVDEASDKIKKLEEVE